jgi:hypothetical protein
VAAKIAAYADSADKNARSFAGKHWMHSKWGFWENPLFYPQGHLSGGDGKTS